MKSKKVIIILLCALLVFVFIIGGILIWFFSPGIHRLFTFTHIEYEADGYLLSTDGEMIGKATLSLNGTAKQGSTTNRDKAYFFDVTLTGAETITQDDHAGGSTGDVNNGIRSLYITKHILPDDLDMSKMELVKYQVLLDDRKHEVLVCIYSFQDSGNTTQQYYFIPTDDPTNAYENINEILMKAFF